MDSYTFALALGGAGLVAMAATGLTHGQGAPHGAPTHAAHSAGHAAGPAAGHSVAHAGGLLHRAAAGRPAGRGGHWGGGLRSALVALASPRVLFSLLLGYGATGVLLRPWIAGAGLVVAGIGGALLLELGLARPLWNLTSRFASRPAATLEASVLSDATATSGFNAEGEGLVAVEVDGQIVQCLGQLCADDRALGVRVRSGDRLRIEEVDAARSRCTVSYVGRSRGAS